MWQDAGFLSGTPDVTLAIKQLGHLLEALPARYRELPAAELLVPPAPGKWTRLELLGHLIDSAVNNLKRFTDIQVMAQPYIVQVYRQDELVKINNYRHLPLEHLLGLWQLLNRQIIYVTDNIPAEKFHYPVNPGYGNGEIKTLAWLICDYTAHLEHHWKQVMA